ncbi:MAG: hypothetical protein VX185_11020 [Pseudomonadota bacterium]|nr:hypothetical protein [Pseudomonadota bacterium]
MKDVHFAALEEVNSQFGECERVDDPESGFQIGWRINAEEERVSFNFTEDAIRIFNIQKKNSQSKYKSLELLRQCAKKGGLHELVFYQFQSGNPVGDAVLAKKGGDIKDGLDEIEEHYKIVPKHETDLTGGSLMRVGSRRR